MGDGREELVLGVLARVLDDSETAGAVEWTEWAVDPSVRARSTQAAVLPSPASPVRKTRSSGKLSPRIALTRFVMRVETRSSSSFGNQGWLARTRARYSARFSST
jgi:hypothetical protein